MKLPQKSFICVMHHEQLPTNKWDDTCDRSRADFLRMQKTLKKTVRKDTNPIKHGLKAYARKSRNTHRSKHMKRYLGSFLFFIFKYVAFKSKSLHLLMTNQETKL